jgi:hypothetical protein
MKSGAIPFKIDMTGPLSWARRHASNRLAGATVTLNLPFVSISVAPKDRERTVARELVIRLKDRRVLSAFECCDDCIDRALASLGEIRKLLVEKQVELSDLADGPMFALMDAMAQGIRQFQTYEELLRLPDGARHGRGAFHRPHDVQQSYFDALELLRGHLSRCLGQVAAMAGMEVPSEGLIAQYQGPWLLEAYVAPETDGGTTSRL